jgi:hypothetical protein
MIRELIDTDLEAVAGGVLDVNAFVGSQTATLINSANLTGVAIGGSVTQVAPAQTNVLSQNQTFTGA